MEQQTQTAESKALTLVPLSIGQMEKAKDMSVDEIKSVFREDSATDVEARKTTAQMTEASQNYLKVSRGLGIAIHDLLAENDDLQKKWSQVLAALATRQDGSAADFKQKLASAHIPFFSDRAKKSIEHEIEANILEILPDLLRQQWDVTQKSADRIQVQKTLLAGSKEEADQHFRQLGDDIIRYREEAQKAREQFDVSRKELAEIEQKLKENEELEKLIEEAKPLPEAKSVLGSEEYSKLMQRRTELMSTDDQREVSLQTTTQEFRAARDGYKLTEVQIGELAVTYKAINAISIMLDAFLKVTRPIQQRAIVIINSQAGGLKGAALLAALSQTMNETIKMCAYGMTVMTERAVALGRMDFVDPNMVEEVKKIQTQNDAVWNDFTKTQYDLVMEKARPLLEHKELGES
jgi:ribosome-binding protein aMBF1 (putative translation factor)